jgi:hypothetical protein
MDINKKSETFSFVSIDNEYKFKGEFTYDVNGLLNINFQVYNLNDANIGNGNYYRYNNTDNVNFNFNCPEELRELFNTQANSIVNEILNYINPEE